MGGRIITERDVSPEQWAGLRERIDLAERAVAARPALDHAAACLDGLGPDLLDRLVPAVRFEASLRCDPRLDAVPKPDPRLEATIWLEPSRSVVSEAAAILDQLSDDLNPSDRDAADAALAAPILARAQALIDAAKARLQS